MQNAVRVEAAVGVAGQMSARRKTHQQGRAGETPIDPDAMRLNSCISTCQKSRLDVDEAS